MDGVELDAVSGWLRFAWLSVHNAIFILRRDWQPLDHHLIPRIVLYFCGLDFYPSSNMTLSFSPKKSISPNCLDSTASGFCYFQRCHEVA
jgi:hypothetical protein